MKLNGTQNIVTGDDITLSNGENLEMRLDNIDLEISDLKGETKWLYKYGGTGSKVGGNSGGGSSTTSNYNIQITLSSEDLNDTVMEDGGTITLPRTGYYELKVKILKIDSSKKLFVLGLYYLKNNANQLVRLRTTSGVASIENNFQYTTTVNLNCNSTFTVNVEDSEIGLKQITFNYIAEPYRFDFSLADLTEDIISSQLFMESYRNKGGLYAKLDYSVLNGTTSYDILYNDKTIFEDGPQYIDFSNSREGTLKFKLPEEFLPETAGPRTLEARIKIEPEGLDAITVNKLIQFSLLPEELYIYVSPEKGRMYDARLEGIPGEDFYAYYKGNLVLNCIVYEGRLQSTATYNVEVYYDGKLMNQEGDTFRNQIPRPDDPIILKCYEQGWHTITLKTASETGTQYSRDYHIYVSESNSVGWYATSLKRLSHMYSFDEKSGKLANRNADFEQTELVDPAYIKDFSVPDASSDVHYDVNIAASILYNSINNDDTPLIYLYEDVDCKKAFVTIYQNKIEFNTGGGQPLSVETYIPKASTYKSDNDDEYHLVNIRYTVVPGGNSNNTYYGMSVYIDGVLDAEFPSLSTLGLRIRSVGFNSTAFRCNLFDISYIQHLDTNESLETLMYRYWLNYRTIYREEAVSDADIDMINILDGFSYDPRNLGMVVCSQSSLISLSSISKVPVMMATISEKAGYDILTNEINRSYKDVKPSFKEIVGISWSAAQTQIDVSPQSYVKYDKNERVQFQLTIQGSSSKELKCKNFNISTVDTSASSDSAITYKYLFSPNFKKSTGSEDNSGTFLPEESFTLKADVQDSSHSKNTGIGLFVNDVTTPFNTRNLGAKYNSYVKNCLEGFPFLMFLRISKEDGSSSTIYYLGVYNFNLGRDSHFNLGYVNLSVLDNAVISEATNNSWGFCELDNTQTAYKNDLVIAEILNNLAHFDFSQCDPSVLFELPSLKGEGLNDGGAMFGDIVANDDHRAENVITEFVTGVAKSGLFIFNSLKKKLGSYDDGYAATDSSGNSLNQVPDNRIQYKREITSGGFKYVENGLKLEGDESDLITLLTDDEVNNIPRQLDYQSLSEYYTVCMALGLVDSVLKNMNIKTWNALTFYAAFYDMDTALGRNNKGGLTSYTAYSDYFNQVSRTSEDSDYVVPVTPLVFRDFTKSGELNNDYTVYDTPSSYLIAVAKYATLFNTLDRNLLLGDTPQELWSRWRSNVTGDKGLGCLKNANLFVDKYIEGNLVNVNTAILNYNYRTKYLWIDGDANYSYVSTETQFFHGKSTEIIKEWLTKRFHLLDSFFNIMNSTIPIEYRKDGSNEWEKVVYNNTEFLEPGNSGIYPNSNNPDVVILKDIFRTDGAAMDGTTGLISLRISSPDYSPLAILTPSQTVRYVTDSRRWLISGGVAGTNISFGGSREWTYIEDISDATKLTSTKNNPLNIISDKLTSITGTDGTLSKGINFQTPAVRTINLTSNKYSGTVTIGNSMLALNSVKLDNTKLGVTITDSPLREFSFVNGLGSISITDCYNLEKFSANGHTTVSSDNTANLTLSNLGAAFDNLQLYNQRIPRVTLSAPNDGKSRKVTIRNNATLTTLSITNFTEIIIENCPKLSTINLGALEKIRVFELKLVGNGITNGVLNYTDSHKENGAKVMNLYGMSNLEKLKLEGVKGFSTLVLPNNGQFTLTNCSGGDFDTIKLDYVKTMTIANSGLFKNSKFKKCSGTWNKVLFTTPNISYMFELTLTTLEEINKMFDNAKGIDGITTIQGLFKNTTTVDYSNETTIANDIKNSLNSNVADSLFKCPHYWKMPKLSNFSEMSGSNMRAVIAKMFSGVSDDVKDISVTGMVGHGTTSSKNRLSGYIQAGAYNKIANRITGFLGTRKEFDYVISHFHVLDSKNGSIKTSYKFTEVFLAMPNVTHIQGIIFTKDDTMDMDKAFDGWTNLQNINYSWYNWLNAVNVNGLLKPLSKLNNVFLSLSFSIASDLPDIDWYNFANWDTLIGNNISIGWENSVPLSYAKKYNTTSRTCKYLSVENFEKLIDLIRNHKCTKFTIILRDVKLLAGQDYTLNLKDMPNIIDLNWAFDQILVCDNVNDTSFYNLVIPRDFFDHFPNVISCVNTFSNNKLSVDFGMDFFRQKLTSSTNVKWLKEDGTYINAVYYYTTYKKSISILRMFEGCTLSHIYYYEGVIDGNTIKEGDTIVHTRDRVVDSENNVHYDAYFNTQGKETRISDPIYDDMNLINLYAEGSTTEKQVGIVSRTFSLGSDWLNRPNPISKIGTISEDNYDKITKSLIVPPDFFMGKSNTVAVFNRTEKMCGLLGPHMDIMESCFNRCQVIPRLSLVKGNDYCYQFIPNNFACENLGILDFSVNLVDSVAGGRLNRLYVFGPKSFKSNRSSFNTHSLNFGTLVVNVTEKFVANQGMLNFNISYNIRDKVVYDGIDTEIYTAAKNNPLTLTHLAGPTLLRLVSGPIFCGDYYLPANNANYILPEDKPMFILADCLAKNIVFPAARGNFGRMNYFQSSDNKTTVTIPTGKIASGFAEIYKESLNVNNSKVRVG